MLSTNNVRLIVLIALVAFPFYSSANADEFVWHDGLQFAVEGQGWKELPNHYCRLPAKAEKIATSAVWNLSKQSAGLLVRFKTDSPVIKVRHQVAHDLAMPHMTATGKSGLDLYALQNGVWQWVGATKPSKKNYEATIASGLSGEYSEFALYLPLYNVTSSLAVGVAASARFEKLPERSEKPIVYYGSSIAQGCSASRPGMTFIAILGRRLNHKIINLGFSGSAKMEPDLADLFAEIDAEMYVIDAFPNMTPDLIRNNAEEFLTRLTRLRPETPILIVDARKLAGAPVIKERDDLFYAKQNEAKKVYEKIVQTRKNIHYLPGDNLLGTDGEGTVDGSHPSDLGMMRMTESLLPIMEKILQRKYR
jgi:lysophospholipase L1-like esterase